MGAWDGPAVEESIAYIPLEGKPPQGGLGRASGNGKGGSLRHFLVGPENRLVEVAVHSLLDETEQQPGPLLFHGPSGTGKSHIAHGLVTAWKARRRRRAALYLTATDFARQLADAIEAQGVADFRHDLLRASLLVIDDIGRLKGKQAAQWELTSLLDELQAGGSRVVVTASTAPAELLGIAPRLRSRLMAGLAVPLVPPAKETRLVLLQQFAGQRNMPIGVPAIEMLADSLSATVPELLGALVQLETVATDRQEEIDLETVEDFVEQRSGSRRVAIPQIALLTSRRFALRVRDLQSASRRREVVRARGVAMYLARELTGSSLQQIGVYFGGRDHTTVLHGCRRTEKLLESEPAFRQAMHEIRRAIGVG